MEILYYISVVAFCTGVIFHRGPFRKSIYFYLINLLNLPILVCLGSSMIIGAFSDPNQLAPNYRQCIRHVPEIWHQIHYKLVNIATIPGQLILSDSPLRWQLAITFIVIAIVRELVSNLRK